MQEQHIFLTETMPLRHGTGELTMGLRHDDAAKAIELLMRMANIIDEKPHALDVGISSHELGMGYRAWTIRLREIIKLINYLQAEKFELLERINLLSCDLRSRPDLEVLTDEHQKEIWAYYKKLLETEANNDEQ